MAKAHDRRPQRFVTAQDGMFDGAMAELAAGRKTSHWICSFFLRRDL